MIYAWCDVPYLGTSWDAPSYAGCITSCGPIPLRPRNNMALTDSMRHAPFFLFKKTLGQHNKSKILRRKLQHAKGPKEIKVYSEDSGFSYGFSLLLRKTPLTPGRPGTTLR